jgi:hypothetical protein
MKLSKALKLKNKKINEYNSLIIKMVTNNSYDIDINKVYNSKELYKEVTIKMNELIQLKTEIHTTSEPIRSLIFRLSELKNLLINTERLDTSEGIVKKSNYRGEISSISTLSVDINELEKEELIKGIQEEIENIQDHIDIFNATTELVGY